MGGNIENISGLPINGGGANFKTRILVQTNTGNYEYRISKQARIFSSIFCIVGLGIAFILTGFITKEITQGTFQYGEWILFALLPIGFLLVGILVFISFSSKIEFDIMNLCCYFGKRVVNFNEIYAVQLISENVYSEDRSGYRRVYRFTSYELNLVLKNQERINIVDHGDKEVILFDAQTISNVIGVPIMGLI